TEGSERILRTAAARRKPPSWSERDLPAVKFGHRTGLPAARSLPGKHGKSSGFCTWFRGRETVNAFYSAPSLHFDLTPSTPSDRRRLWAGKRPGPWRSRRR